MSVLRVLWLSLSRPSYVAYGCSAMLIAAVQNMFLLYHVEVFVSNFKIDQTSFQLGSVAFLIWNAFNDFILGWISDRALLSKFIPGDVSMEGSMRRQRIRGIAVGGPLMGICLIAMFLRWPWFPIWFQYVVSMCLYDTCLTWVDLSHSSLLAELTPQEEERSTMSMIASVCSAAGSSIVFISFLFWDKENLGPFRYFMVMLVGFSIVGFRIAAAILYRMVPTLPKNNAPSEYVYSKPSECASDAPEENSGMGIFSFLLEAIHNPNLMWFTLLSLVQTFHCHFNSNFFPLFLAVLLRGQVSPFWQSFVLGLSFFLPHVNNVYFTSLVKTMGTYSVVWRLLLVKLGMAVIIVCGGPDNWVLILLFVASNRVFTEGICKLLNLVVSDLIDEDTVIHKRQSSVSALIFGTINLFTKPGQSLAPLLGTYYIARHCDGFIFSTEASFDEPAVDKLLESGVIKPEDDKVRWALFLLLVYVPLGCAFVQLFAWGRFKLHGDHLQLIRQARKNIRYEQARAASPSRVPIDLGAAWAEKQVASHGNRS